MSQKYSHILLNRILYLCAKQEISINELAHRSNLPQSTIDNFVQGKVRCPTLKTVHMIANGFGMTPAEFLNIPEINNYMFSGSRQKKKKIKHIDETSQTESSD